MNKHQQALTDFERILDMAEIRALSNKSLRQPPTDKEFKRMMELRDKLFKVKP